MPGSFAFAVRIEVCAALISVALLAAGCGDKSRDSGSSSSGDNLPGAIKAQRDATMTLDTNALTKAIDRFNVDIGRNPKDLDELVKEKYISAVPKPPFGTKIVYDAASGRVNIVADR